MNDKVKYKGFSIGQRVKLIARDDTQENENHAGEEFTIKAFPPSVLTGGNQFFVFGHKKNGGFVRTSVSNIKAVATENKATDKKQEPQPGSKQLLNDVFRKSLGMTGSGRVVMTSGVDGLPDEIKTKVLLAVRDFDNFETGDDPYGQHDFAVIELDGRKIYWKIDYYDENFEYGGDVNRLLTIMLASEY